jgi:hypothetical protein
LLTGTPQDAADQIRRTFPLAQQLHEAAKVVGSAPVEAIRQVGFDVAPVATRNLPNHGRLIHAAGVSGFTGAELTRLSQVFQDTSGC